MARKNEAPNLKLLLQVMLKMPKLKTIVFIAFLLRILLIPFFSDDFNFWAARAFTKFSMNGFNPWTTLSHDPTLTWINPWRTPPPVLLLVAPAQAVGAYFRNEIVFFYLLKMPLVLADLVSIFFLHRILTCLLYTSDAADE